MSHKTSGQIQSAGESRVCVDCGSSYIYSNRSKKGVSANRCGRCTRRHSDENTRRLMLEAAGGGCAHCGYQRSVSAMRFIDPLIRLEPLRKGRNRQQKIEWASHHIVLCCRCAHEIDDGMLHYKVYDKESRPPKVGFWTDEAQIVPPDSKEDEYADIEIVSDDELKGKDLRVHGKDA